jgi:ubiquitin-conjugating enzyme E2 H
VTDYVQKYATKEAIEATEDESDSGDDMSSIDSFSDEEAAGLEL